jgi:hypothetical protein
VKTGNAKHPARHLKNVINELISSFKNAASLSFGLPDFTDLQTFIIWGCRLLIPWSTAVPALRCYSAAKADAQTFSGISTSIGQPLSFTNFAQQKMALCKGCDCVSNLVNTILTSKRINRGR